jgi:hypothetical protein
VPVRKQESWRGRYIIGWIAVESQRWLCRGKFIFVIPGECKIASEASLHVTFPIAVGLDLLGADGILQRQ